MRVAHVTATFPPYRGGAGTACWHQAAGLAARGHEVTVYTAPPAGVAAGPHPEDPPGVRVVRERPVVALGNAPLLPGLARLRGHDVIHLHYPFIFGADLLLAASLRPRATPLVVSYNNRLVGPGPRGLLFEAYEHSSGPLVVHRARRVLVLSLEHADSVPYLARLRRRHPERFRVVPGGVDLERFRPAGAAERPARDRTVAVQVAALDRAHHFKRVDRSLETLRRVPELELVVIGDGESRPELEARGRALGVAERVTWAGSPDDDALAARIRTADLFLFPSDPPESFGIVVAEAMASGLPAVVSDIPGPAGLVRHGETGYLVPRGDLEALAGAVRRVVEAGPEGRTRMGAAARAEAERRYGWRAVVDGVEAAYLEAVR